MSQARLTELKAFYNVIYTIAINCPLETKSKCYKAMVKPILDYAATVWSPCTAWSPHTQKYYRKKPETVCVLIFLPVPLFHKC